MTRAHSFPRPAKFRGDPQNLGFGRGIELWNFYRGIRLFAAECRGI